MKHTAWEALVDGSYVASLDDDERIHHCQAAVAVFQELSTFLVPDVLVHIHDPDGDGASDDSDADPGHGSLVDSVFLTKQLVARRVAWLSCVLALLHFDQRGRISRNIKDSRILSRQLGNVVEFRSSLVIFRRWLIGEFGC